MSSRAAIQPGDTTTITVVIANHTSRRITLSGGGCFLSYEVLDSTRQVVAPGLRGCPDYLAFHPLEPGATLAWRFVWRGDTYDLIPTGEPFPSQRTVRKLLPPGRYQLVGLLNAEEMTARSAPLDQILIPARQARLSEGAP
jgi:hypothetical protein